MKAKSIVTLITISLYALLLDFYIFFLCSQWLCDMLVAFSRVLSYLIPWIQRLYLWEIKSQDQAPMPAGFVSVQHAVRSREAEQGCAWLRQLGSVCHACFVLLCTHRGTPPLVEPLGLLWGFIACSSYSSELQPFIYKLSMKCDCGESTWAG